MFKKFIYFLPILFFLAAELTAGGIDVGQVVPGTALDIVSVGEDGRLYAWDNKAVSLGGFPLTLPARRFVGRPCVANIDLSSDGVEEIAVLTRAIIDPSFHLAAFGQNGVMIFDVPLNFTPSPDSFAVADLDPSNDGLEIFVADRFGKIRCFNRQGVERVDLGFDSGGTSPVSFTAEDINQDGRAELIVNTGKKVALFSWETASSSWTKVWEYELDSPSVVACRAGDMNADNVTEVAAIDRTGGLYLLTASGQLIWRRETGIAPSAPAIFARFDLDDHRDVAVCLQTREIVAFDYAGEKISEEEFLDLNNTGFPRNMLAAVLDSWMGSRIDFLGLKGLREAWGFFYHFDDKPQPFLNVLRDTTSPLISNPGALSSEAGEDVVISCDLSDVEFGVLMADLFYRTGSMTVFRKARMTPVNGHFQAVIPAVDAIPGTVEFRIIANDGFGNSTKFPSVGSTASFSLSDTTPPEALCMSLPDIVPSRGPVIDAKVYVREAVGFGTEPVVLHWTIADQDGSIKGTGSVPMSLSGRDDRYLFTVPGLDLSTCGPAGNRISLLQNDLVSFYVAGHDSAGHEYQTAGNSPASPLRIASADDDKVVLLWEDFEDKRPDDFIVEKGMFEPYDSSGRYSFASSGVMKNICRYGREGSDAWRDYEFSFDLDYNGAGFSAGWGWIGDTYSGRGFILQYDTENKRIIKQQNGYIYVLRDLSDKVLYGGVSVRVKISWDTVTGVSKIDFGPYSVSVTNSMIEAGSVWISASGSRFDNLQVLGNHKPLPLPPENVHTESLKAGKIGISWNAPAINYYSDFVTAYNIYRSGPGTPEGQPVFSSVTPPQTGDGRFFFLDSTAAEGSVWYYRITSLDALGQESVPSIQVWARSDGTVLPPLALEAASGVNGTVRLSWQAPEGEPVLYNIYRSSTPVVSASPALRIASFLNEVSFQDSLEGSGIYYYSVTAVDSSSNESVLAGPVSAPVDVSVPAGGVVLDSPVVQSDGIHLNWEWTGDSGEIDHFTVYRLASPFFDPAFKAGITADNLPVSAGSFVDPAGKGPGSWYYRVAAVAKANGNIVFSPYRLSDTLPPEIIIDFPSSGDELHERCSIEGHLFDTGDSGLSAVFEYSGDNGRTFHPISTSSVEAGVSLTPDARKIPSAEPSLLADWDTADLADGIYVLRCTVSDGAGNTRTVSLDLKKGDLLTSPVSTSDSVDDEFVKYNPVSDSIFYNALSGNSYTIRNSGIKTKTTLDPVIPDGHDNLLLDTKNGRLLYLRESGGRLLLYLDQSPVAGIPGVDRFSSGTFSPSAEWISLRTPSGLFFVKVSDFQVVPISLPADTDGHFVTWIESSSAGSEKAVVQTLSPLGYDLFICGIDGSVSPFAADSADEIAGANGQNADVFVYTLHGTPDRLLFRSLSTGSEAPGPVVSGSDLAFEGWSPDGGRFAVSEGRDLLVFDSGRNLQTRLTNTGFGGWSPNSAMIACERFVSGSANNSDLYIFDLVSGRLVPVVANAVNDVFCSWDADSSALVYSREMSAGNNLLSVCTPDPSLFPTSLFAGISRFERSGTKLRIYGTVSSPNLEQYSLFIKPLFSSSRPEILVLSSSVPAVESLLAEIDVNDPAFFEGTGFYEFRLTASDDAGRSSESVKTAQVMDTVTVSALPPEIIGLHASENRISFFLTRDADVSVDVFHSSGSEIVSSIGSSLTAGSNELTWPGTGPSGTLFVRGDYPFYISASLSSGETGTGLYGVVNPPLSLFAGIDPSYISPNADGSQDLAEISIRINGTDRTKVVIQKPDGGRVKTLFFGSCRPLPFVNRFYWNGCDDAGIPIEDGLYLCRITVDGHPELTRLLSVAVDRPSTNKSFIYTEIRHSDAGFRFGAWSPDSSGVTFSRYTNSVLLPLYWQTNGTVIPLDSGGWSEFLSSWISDTASCIRDEAGVYSLVLRNLPVLNADSVDIDPLYSVVRGVLNPADPSVIALQTVDNGRYDLYLLKLTAGPVLQEIRSAGPGLIFQSWSPDGKKILCTTDDGLNPDVLVCPISADGLSVESTLKITDGVDRFESAGEGSWSPDGRYVAFQTRNTTGNVDLLLYDLSGSSVIRLAVNPFYQEVFGGWSPPGRLVAFNRIHDGDSDLVVRNVESLAGGMEVPHASFSSWLNDGFRFVYNAHNAGPEKTSVGIADYASRQTRLLGGADGVPERSQGSSPDGRMFVFERTDGTGKSLKFVRLPGQFQDTVLAAITSPLDNAVQDNSVGAVVRINGSAYASDLKFFRIEVRRDGAGYHWLSLCQTAVSRVDDVLCEWDLSQNLPDGPGRYLIRLTVADQAGNTASDLKTVFVTGNPVISSVSADVNHIFYSVSEIVDLTVAVYSDPQLSDPVRTFIVNRTGPGSRDCFWDGRDDLGNLVPWKKYWFRLTAVDRDGLSQAEAATGEIYPPHIFDAALENSAFSPNGDGVKDAAVLYFLSNDWEHINLQINGSEGQDFGTLTPSFTSAGINEFLWDGLSGGGLYLPDGVYRLRLSDRWNSESFDVRIDCREKSQTADPASVAVSAGPVPENRLFFRSSNPEINEISYMNLSSRFVLGRADLDSGSSVELEDPDKRDFDFASWSSSRMYYTLNDFGNADIYGWQAGSSPSPVRNAVEADDTSVHASPSRSAFVRETFASGRRGLSLDNGDLNDSPTLKSWASASEDYEFIAWIDDDRFIFQRDTPDDSNLYVYDRGQDRTIGLAVASGIIETAGEKSLSPDRSMFVYSGGLSDAELTICNLRTGAQTVLSKPGLSPVFLSWKHDSGGFTWFAVQDGRKVLYYRDLASSSDLLIDPDMASGGIFSPAEPVVMYSRVDSGFGRLILNNVLSARSYAFFGNEADGNDRFCAWSADGKKIIFLRSLNGVESLLSAAFKIDTSDVITAAITSPSTGQSVRGYVRFTGSAGAADFEKYVIEYCKTALPERWTAMAENAHTVQNAELAVVDSRRLSGDGLYRFRLRVFDDAGNTGIDEVSLNVDNYDDEEGPSAVTPFPVAFSFSSDTLTGCYLLDDTSGIDTNTIILRVNGIEYPLSDPGLFFNPVNGRLTFDPSLCKPDPVVFAEGQPVSVMVVRADDHAGNPLGFPLSWEWTYSSLPSLFKFLSVDGSSVSYELNADCGVSISIFSNQSDTAPYRELESSISRLADTRYMVSWNGTNKNGLPAVRRPYPVRITATGPSGTAEERSGLIQPPVIYFAIPGSDVIETGADSVWSVRVLDNVYSGSVSTLDVLDQDNGLVARIENLTSSTMNPVFSWDLKDRYGRLVGEDFYRIRLNHDSLELSREDWFGVYIDDPAIVKPVHTITYPVDGQVLSAPVPGTVIGVRGVIDVPGMTAYSLNYKPASSSNPSTVFLTLPVAPGRIEGELGLWNLDLLSAGEGRYALGLSVQGDAGSVFEDSVEVTLEGEIPDTVPPQFLNVHVDGNRIYFTLSESCSVSVSMVDGSVAEIEAEEGRENSFDWNGRDSAGNLLAFSSYPFTLSADDGYNPAVSTAVSVTTPLYLYSVLSSESFSPNADGSGDTVGVDISLNNPSDNALSIRVRDVGGNMLHEWAVTPSGKEHNFFIWDGKIGTTAYLPDGNYSLVVRTVHSGLPVSNVLLVNINALLVSLNDVRVVPGSGPGEAGIPLFASWSPSSSLFGIESDSAGTRSVSVYDYPLLQTSPVLPFEPGDLALSSWRDDDRLGLTEFHEGDFNAFKLNRKTGLKTSLFVGADSRELSPLLSPDSGNSAWQVLSGHRYGLVVKNQSGVVLASFSHTDTNYYPVAWSSDGTKLLIRKESDESSLMVADFQTGSAVLTGVRMPGRDLYAGRNSWQKDREEKIAFTASSGAVSEIFVFDLATSAVIPCTDPGDKEMFEDWTPEGGEIICTRVGDDGSSEIRRVVPGDPSSSQVLVSDAEFDGLSPDGNLVLFSRDSKINAWDGITGQMINLTPVLEPARFIDISPDRRKIAWFDENLSSIKIASIGQTIVAVLETPVSGQRIRRAFDITGSASCDLFDHAILELKSSTASDWEIIATLSEPSAQSSVLARLDPLSAGLDQGGYDFRLTVADVSGNVREDTASFVFDSLPPVITITGPEDGMDYSGPVTIVYQAVDQDPVTAVMTVNGALTPSGAEFSELGTYICSVRAEDPAGNVKVKEITFTIGNPPSAVLAISPAGPVTAPGTFNLVLDCSSDIVNSDILTFAPRDQFPISVDLQPDPSIARRWIGSLTVDPSMNDGTAIFSFKGVSSSGMTGRRLTGQNLLEIRLSDTPLVSGDGDDIEPAAVKSGDTVHLVWRNVSSSGSSIRYAAFLAGVQSSSAVQIPTASSSVLTPDIAANPSGSVYVVWRDDAPSSSGIWFSRFDPSSDWAPAQKIGDGFHPSIAVANGQVVIVWEQPENGVYRIHERKFSESSTLWSGISVLAEPAVLSGIHAVRPDLCEENGVLDLIYETGSDLRFRKNTGIGWSEPVAVAGRNSSSESMVPRIYADNDTVNVVFNNPISGSARVFFISSPDQGLTWRSAVELTAGSSSSSGPACVAGDWEGLYAAWSDATGEIFWKASWDQGVTWTETARATFDPAISRSPVIVPRSQTSLGLFWEDNRSGSFDILSDVLSKPALPFPTASSPAVDVTPVVLPSDTPEGNYFAFNLVSIDEIFDVRSQLEDAESFPLYVSFYYTDDELAGMTEEDLAVMTWDTDLHEWIPAALSPADLIVDTDNNIMTVRIRHFSYYGIFVNTSTLPAPVFAAKPVFTPRRTESLSAAVASDCYAALHVNGKFVTNLFSASSADIVFPSVSLSEGTNIIRARSMGRHAELSPWSGDLILVSDTVGPSVRLLDLSPLPYVAHLSALSSAFEVTEPVKLTVEIYNANNNLTARLCQSLDVTNSTSLAWDGKNRMGLIAGPGIYSLRVSAIDRAGNIFSVDLAVFQVNSDVIPPVSSISVLPDLKISGQSWAGKESRFILSAVDPSAAGIASGVSNIYFAFQPAESSTPLVWREYSSAFVVPENISGDFTLFYKAIDKAGNQELVRSVFFKFDQTAPSSSVTVSGPVVFKNGLYYVTKDSLFAVTSSDTGTGVKTRYVSLDGFPFVVYTGPVGFSSSGSHSLSFMSMDSAGNKEVPQSASIIRDDQPPVTTCRLTGEYLMKDGKTWVSPASTAVFLDSSDAGSGLSRTWFSLRLSSEEPPSPSQPSDWSEYSADQALAVPSAGVWTLYFRSEDLLANMETIQNAVFTAPLPDTALPQSELVLSRGYYESDAGLFVNSGTLFTFKATDFGDNGYASGILKTEYKLCPQPCPELSGFTVYLNPFFVDLQDGVYFLEYRSVDKNLNEEPVQEKELRVDSMAPGTTPVFSAETVSAGGNIYARSGVELSLDAVDPGSSASGLRRTRFVLSANPVADMPQGFFTSVYGGPITLSNSVSYLGFFSEDNLGNSENAEFLTLVLDDAVDSAEIVSPVFDEVLGGNVDIYANIQDPILAAYTFGCSNDGSVNFDLYSSGPVLINECSATDLTPQKIPLMTDELAGRILAARPFDSFEDLALRTGLTQGTPRFESLKNSILLPLADGRIMTWNTRLLSDGEYSLVLRASDGLGNALTNNIRVVVDNTAPLIVFDQTNGTPVTSNPFLLTGKVTDEHFTECGIYLAEGLSPQDWFPAGSVVVSGGDGSFTNEIDCSLFWGIVSVKITADDPAGNHSEIILHLRHKPKIVLNEVAAGASLSTNDPFWVELLSQESGNFDWRKLLLTDLDGPPLTIAFPALSVSSNCFIVMHFKPGISETSNTGDNGYLDLYTAYPGIVPRSDQFVLIVNDLVVDAVVWSDGSPYTEDDVLDMNWLNERNEWMSMNAVQWSPSLHASTARIPGHDNNIPADWIACGVATEGSVNDDQPPRTSVSFGQPAFTTNSVVHISSLSAVSLESVDDLSIAGDSAGVGVRETLYSFVSSITQIYSAPFNVETEGARTLLFRSVDLAGNAEEWNSRSILVDNTPPPVPGRTDAYIQEVAGVALYWPAVSDPDLAGYFVYDNGVKLDVYPVPSNSLIVTVSYAGSHSFAISSVDRLGNESALSVPVSVVIDASVKILSPVPSVFYRDMLIVKGLLAAPSSKGTLIIEYGSSENPSSWILIKEFKNWSGDHSDLNCPWKLEDGKGPAGQELNGIFRLRVRYISEGIERSDSVIVHIDNEPPVTTAVLMPESTLEFDPQDPGICTSGVKSTFYKFIGVEDGTEDWITWDESAVMIPIGARSVRFFSEDRSVKGVDEADGKGNIESIKILELNTQADGQIVHAKAGITFTPKGSPSDAGSGDPGSGGAGSCNTGFDDAGSGNTGSGESAGIGQASISAISTVTDLMPPQITISGVEDGKQYNRNLEVTVKVTDSDLARSFSTIDGQVCPDTITLTAEKDYHLTVRAVDTANNWSVDARRFAIDKTPPQISISGVVQDGVYSFVAPVVSMTDAYPDPDSLVVFLNGGPFVSGTQIRAPGSYDLFASARDMAGNLARESVGFNVTGEPASNSLSFMASYDLKANPDRCRGSTNLLAGGLLTPAGEGYDSASALSETGIGAAYSALSNVNSAAGTLMMWVKPFFDRIGPNGRWLFSLRTTDSAGLGDYYIDLALFEDKGTVIRFKDADGGITEYSDATNLWYTNKDWTHVAFAWDSSTGTVRLFIGGSAVQTWRVPAWTAVAGQKFWVGNRHSDKSRTSECRIDEFRIYGRLLEQAEVDAEVHRFDDRNLKGR